MGEKGKSMTETKKLFYEDCYRTTFHGKVTGTGRDETGAYVLLDETLFFPEGGGQPADHGRLNGHIVWDVQEVEGQIRHYIKKDTEIDKPGEASPERNSREEIAVHGSSGRYPKEEEDLGQTSPEGNTRKEETTHMLLVGDLVEGVIDWDRRFDLMQQHSGEHIVSGKIHARFGYDNVGFHMGERFITIDLNGLIDNRQLYEIEEEVNRYIWQDKPVKAFMASEEEIHNLDYRSKLDLVEEVRLVEYPGADLCACCGLHVNTTGQIGLVKLVSVHRFRQGVRIEMLSGRRAFRYLNEQARQNSAIAVELSSKPENTADAVDRLKEENFRLRGEIIRLEKEKNAQLADRLKGCGDVVVFAGDLNPVEIRKCADEILNGCGGICVLLSGDDNKGYRYAIGVRDGDIRDLVREMNKQLDGRGGGKPFFAQGSLQGKRDRLEEFFKKKGFAISQ